MGKRRLGTHGWKRCTVVAGRLTGKFQDRHFYRKVPTNSRTGILHHLRGLGKKGKWVLGERDAEHHLGNFTKRYRQKQFQNRWTQLFSENHKCRKTWGGKCQIPGNWSRWGGWIHPRKQSFPLDSQSDQRLTQYCAHARQWFFWQRSYWHQIRARQRVRNIRLR